MTLPIVAIVGRPNVGKSTLFNRLAGERLAIVDDTPGTTRDRLFAETEWNGRQFHIIDTGGIDPTSGGGKTPLSISSAEYIQEIRDQALVAIQEADAILFLVDTLSGLTSADKEVTEILRRYQKKKNGLNVPPILLVANKADNSDLRSSVSDFYQLGLGEPYPISAIHGTGTGDLLDELVKVLPENEEATESNSIKIAIVGKPNVGKSSLLNKIVGEERAIVSPIAGTTRDALDTHITYQERNLTLIDTAGIRKRGKIDRGVEKYSVIRSMRAIERSDVALLVIDATQPLSAQDTHIAGFILDAWKSAIVLVNKWDVVEKNSYTMDEFRKRIQYALNFMDYVPTLFISAKTGQRVQNILPETLRVQEERMVKIKTGLLNRVLLRAQDQHAPTSKTGRILRIYYGTQVRSDPPTFMLFVNDPQLAHFTYLRYLENQLRKEYPFTGTPIRLVLKAR
ncbi:MAG: ribosome biogenesis GTPase Der [Anaerolineaceae bacterium]|nr:ribosome biogenesis GTPase Der [Anaerolineaceae bacterium]